MRRREALAALALTACAGRLPAAVDDDVLARLLRDAGPQSRRVLAAADEFEPQVLWTRCVRSSSGDWQVDREHALGVKRQRWFAAASFVKLPLAALLLEQLCARGLIDRIDELRVDVDARAACAPLPAPVKGGWPLLRLLRAMCVVSDNRACNALYELLGSDAIHRRLGELGYGDCRIGARLGCSGKRPGKLAARVLEFPLPASGGEDGFLRAIGSHPSERQSAVPTGRERVSPEVTGEGDRLTERALRQRAPSSGSCGPTHAGRQQADRRSSLPTHASARAPRDRSSPPLAGRRTDGKVVWDSPAQPEERPQLFPFGRALKGRAWLQSGQQIAGAHDFSDSNFMPLADVHRMTLELASGQSIGTGPSFALCPKARQLLAQIMAMTPRKCPDPVYASGQFADDHSKWLVPLDAAGHQQAGLRIASKNAQSYGYIGDSAFIVDEARDIAFGLSATVFVDRDGVLNDGRYAYDDIGRPFLRELGAAVLAHERAAGSTRR